MKRVAVFALLLALSVGWLAQASAQSPGVAEYARTSREMDKKYAKQQKAMKKNAKAQRKAAKRANRPAR